MSQETSASTTSTNIAKPKKRWVTGVLLLVLIGVGLFAVDRAANGKFFKTLQDTAATTIGGSMNDEQKNNVDKFQKRLSELRSQREAIANGEVSVPPTENSAEEKPTEKVDGPEPGKI